MSRQVRVCSGFIKQLGHNLQTTVVPRQQVGGVFIKHVHNSKLSFIRSLGSEARNQLYEETLDMNVSDKAEVGELVDRYLHVGEGHRVLLIQPFVRKAGDHIRTELLLAESRALVETLDWTVVDHIPIGLSSFKKKHLFGSGNLTLLRDRVEQDSSITAVFISLYQLTATQRIQLEFMVRVPVIDRYHLVLQIFYEHARSMESQLQVSLAEIPYLKNRLVVQYEIESGSKHSGGNLGEKYFESRRFVLKKLQSRIRKKIDGVKLQRQKLRQGRKKNDIPTVAVIGYTNCGKTSLIKSLTGADLEPKDRLFATLDVTCHGTKLPNSNMDVVFIDTVGFISDIPTPLIASFSSTLEDALHADMLLHVRDFSHPDHVNQASQVLATLARLGVPHTAVSNMLTVGNKIDKIPTNQWAGIKHLGALPVSATEGHGLSYLVTGLEESLVRVTDRLCVQVRVRPGSEEWGWLVQHASVGRIEVCQKDMNFSLVNLVISRPEMEKFKSKFVSRSRGRESGLLEC